jgi:hypothetical protein
MCYAYDLQFDLLRIMRTTGIATVHTLVICIIHNAYCELVCILTISTSSYA